MATTYSPSPDQLAAIRNFAAKPGFGLFADPGVGKTSVTLAGCTLFKAQAAMQGALVVSPIRPMLQAWRQEAAKWSEFKGLRISLVRGTPKQRLEALRVDADIYLINPELVSWLAKDAQANAALRADVLVLDESHKFKDHTTARFKALKKLRRLFRRVYLLTGTPAPERLEDLWSQIFMIDGGARLGRTLTEFRSGEIYIDEARYRAGLAAGKPVRREQYEGRVSYLEKVKEGFCEQIYREGAPVADWVVRADRKDEIARLISDVTQVIKLPPANIRRNEIFVDLPAAAVADYRTLEREYAVALASGPVRAANAAGLQAKLRQFVNGAVYGEERVVHKSHDAKLEALADLVEEQNGAPLLVVVAYQHDVARIREHLKDPTIPYIGDGISDRELDRVMADWNAKKLPVLLLHPASGGEGLNMQAGGSAICWFGLTWSLKDYIQTNARLRAHLQAGVVIHFLLVRGTVDEHVYNGLNIKDTNQEAFTNRLIDYMKGKL